MISFDSLAALQLFSFGVVLINVGSLGQNSSPDAESGDEPTRMKNSSDFDDTFRPLPASTSRPSNLSEDVRPTGFDSNNITDDAYIVWPAKGRKSPLSKRKLSFFDQSEGVFTNETDGTNSSQRRSSKGDNMVHWISFQARRKLQDGGNGTGAEETRTYYSVNLTDPEWGISFKSIEDNPVSESGQSEGAADVGGARNCCCKTVKEAKLNIKSDEDYDSRDVEDYKYVDDESDEDDPENEKKEEEFGTESSNELSDGGCNEVSHSPGDQDGDTATGSKSISGEEDGMLSFSKDELDDSPQLKTDKLRRWFVQSTDRFLISTLCWFTLIISLSAVLVLLIRYRRTIFQTCQCARSRWFLERRHRKPVMEEADNLLSSYQA